MFLPMTTIGKVQNLDEAMREANDVNKKEAGSI